MNDSNRPLDIARLFAEFGGDASTYREIGDGGDTSSFVEPSPPPPIIIREIAPKDGEHTEPSEKVSGLAFESVNQPVMATTGKLAPHTASVGANEQSAPERVVAAEPRRETPLSLKDRLARLQQEHSDPAAEPIETPARIIAVVSVKGGVGKSTVSANLGGALRELGRSVVALDLDPQNALYQHLDDAARDPQDDIANVSLAHLDWGVIRSRTACGIDLLPYGTPEEAERQAFEQMLQANPRWLSQRLLELQLSAADILIIDTPSGSSVYLQQALSVADLVLILTQPDAASYYALSRTEKVLGAYAAEQPTPFGNFYLINQIDESNPLAQDIAQIAREVLGERVIGSIRRDLSFNAALANNQTLIDYAPDAPGAQDIFGIAAKINAALSRGI
jgi:cellulose synthase operon protein YhjQ